MIRILFYNHTGKVSGAEQMLLLILAKLDRNRFESVVLCPNDDTLARDVQGLGLNTESCPDLNARFTLRVDLIVKYLRSFAKVIQSVRTTVIKVQPDLVHANSIRAGLVVSVATIGLKTRVVWHLHDLLPSHPLSVLIRGFALLYPRTVMIAVSQAVADNFGGRFVSLRNRVSVILNGIDTEKFAPVEGRREETRKELGFDESEFVVGIVGLLTPRKGQLGLIRSFAQVLRRVPKAKLLIVGGAVFNKDAEYEALLKTTANDLGISKNVQFLGVRKDVPAIMQGLDLFVANSSVEPFGLVIVEALSAGAPVLSSISGGIPEVVQCGRSGWLIEYGDEALMTEAIVKLAQTPRIREKLSEEGRKRSRDFTAARFMNELQTFYEANTEVRTLKSSQDSAVPQSATAKIA